jgi:phosphate transport system substrate-binding protein
MVNIPGLAANSLNFSRKALLGIFSGSITRWNDTEITTYNKNLNATMQNHTITVVYRLDNAGASQTLTAALSSFNSTIWPYGSVGKLPAAVTNVRLSLSLSLSFHTHI